MKITLTIIMENDKPVSALNGMTEEKIKKIWQALLDVIAIQCDNGDKATVLSAEILEKSDGWR